MIRRAAPTRVGFLQGADIESIRYFDNKPGKVVFRQPFIHRGRKQVAGLAINGMEAAHFTDWFRLAPRHYPIGAGLVRQAARISESAQAAVLAEAAQALGIPRAGVPAFADNPTRSLTGYSPRAVLPTLHAASEIVRLGERRLLQSESDWEFLSSYLLVLNQNWTRFLAEQRRQGAEGNADAEMVDSAFAMLEQLGLIEASDANAVISRVSDRFFDAEKIEAARCVQLAQIAAKLGAAVGENFRFVTQDRSVRQASANIVADEDARIAGLFAPEWVDAHILARDYFADYRSCTRDEWLQWAKSPRSRLVGFAMQEERKASISGQAKAKKELERRGIVGQMRFRYATGVFEVHDWDFAEEHWRHWTALAEVDPANWGRIVERLLATPEAWLARWGSAKIIQQATTKRWCSVTERRLLPNWILRFRELPCLRDTRGNYRKPGDLLRRTPETEPFMDVEPFVDARLDTEASRWLLKLLGVRDVPTGPDRLLEILRALSRAKNPPGHEVDKWYARLDQILDHGSTKDLDLVRSALQQEKLIFAASGEWATAAGVFLSTDEEDVPGVLVVRPSVRDLTDDKALPKAERKRLQVEHAAAISRRAKLVKLADKICNLRDIASSPPADWSVERKREYFDWAKAVVDGLRGVHPGLEHLFDEAYRARP